MRNNLGPDSRGCLPADTQGRGRGGSAKDLEIGAVDELLVGVSVFRDKDKGEKFTLWNSPPAFRLSTFIMTNNNSLFCLSSCLLMTFRSLNLFRLLFRA